MYTRVWKNIGKGRQRNILNGKKSLITTFLVESDVLKQRLVWW